LLPEIEFITPILNVSNVPKSLRWFEQIGWRRTFTWNHAGVIEEMQDSDDNGIADFAGIGSGNVQIFLCQDGQGSRGEGLGSWISVWVPDTKGLDLLYHAALENGMNVILGVTDQPWGAREFRLMHPDGHVLRINAFL
jgi:uncharacterized glyoxalase superfamily protein PhnB